MDSDVYSLLTTLFVRSAIKDHLSLVNEKQGLKNSSINKVYGGFFLLSFCINLHLIYDSFFYFSLLLISHYNVILPYCADLFA